jgi:hypothetical protein
MDGHIGILQEDRDQSTEDRSSRKRRKTETAMFRSSAELRALYRTERKVKESGLGRIIASRILTEGNARDHKIIVTVGAPRRIEADNWLCPYRIEGIVDSGIHYSYGVDALQALILALAGIRYDLDQTKRRFIWFADDHGIPRQVPTGYGMTFERRVERAIHRESKRYWLGVVRVRKAEIAFAEARLKVLKKGTSRWNEPAGKANLQTKIREQEVRIKAAKKATAEWEADLRKWKPAQDPKL